MKEHYEQLEELLKMDIQYNKCTTDEQRQFIRDNLDGLLLRVGFDRTKQIINSEIACEGIINLFQTKKYEYNEMMHALAHVIASIIPIIQPNKARGMADFARLMLEISSDIEDHYANRLTPEQRRYFEIFDKKQFLKGATDY